MVSKQFICSILAAVCTFLVLCLAPKNDPVYRYGFNLTKLEFNLHTADMGVRPTSQSLMIPTTLSNGVLWNKILQMGYREYGAGRSPILQLTTMLAREPAGEHQFYTARALDEIWQAERADLCICLLSKPWPFAGIISPG